MGSEHKGKNTGRNFQVPNLERALDMLELLARNPRGLSLVEITEKLEVPGSSVYRIAMTLQQRGYLRRDEETRRFSLTSNLLRLGYAAMNEQNLVEIALEAIRELREAARETVRLGALRDAEGVILAELPGLHQFKFTIDPGMFLCLHTAAPAKAILALLPGTELGWVLRCITFQRHKARTITSQAAFLRELAAIRDRRYAVDHAEEFAGVRCVAAAVNDVHGHPVAAVWTTGLAERMPAGEFPS